MSPNSPDVPETGGVSLWVLAARPKTLWAAVAPVMIGTALAYSDRSEFWLAALAALLGAVLIQIGTNFANDYFDYNKGADTSQRLGPVRVTQAGLVSPGTMKRATVIVFTMALLVGVYLVWRGGWPVVVIGLLSILFGVLYTAGPFPLAYNGLGEIFVLIFFGPVAVAGTYYVQALTITPEAIIAGLAPGLFSVAILAVNNLRDIVGDRASGKKTLAVRFGVRFARWEYATAVIVAVLVPLLLVLRQPDHRWALLSLFALPIAVPTVASVLRGTEGRALNDTLAVTGRLLLFFSVLFSIGWLL
ncbi:MAG: 1,4-dihydroxy-2-naphthoate polyprenyltransferase [candidate division Zixibacteria bacterium]|nr:1,4-dihydroxy-2-naphthoate polyprenyltransferase [candidate division Zixibacteria bacterium]